MKILDTKLRHLTAISTAESFFPFAPIEYRARKFLAKGKSAAHRITSILMSKLGASERKNQTPLYESFYSKNAGPKGGVYALANNPTTPASLLDYIAINCPVSVSESIAGNENASETTLQRLANHYSPQVRAAVTENCHTPFETLAYLCERAPRCSLCHGRKSPYAKIVVSKISY